MAFPTSPSNNQVHKEGNRAFVYDSTLGVWDQIQETPSTIYGTSMSTGSERNLDLGIGSSYKRGSILQVRHHICSQSKQTTSTDWTDVARNDAGSAWNPGITPISAESGLLWMFTLNFTTTRGGVGDDCRGKYAIREYQGGRGFHVVCNGFKTLGNYVYGTSAGTWKADVESPIFMTTAMRNNMGQGDGGSVWDGTEIFCRIRFACQGSSLYLTINSEHKKSYCTVMEVVL